MGRKVTVPDLVPVKEQPYPIPVNWTWKNIGNVVKLFTGNSINERVKKEKYEGLSEGYVYIATKDIGFDGVINYDTNVKIPKSDLFKVAPPNTALLCIEGGSAGRKIGFVNQAVCFVNKLCAFYTTQIHSKYVFYFLQTQCFSNQFARKKHGLIGGVPLKSLAASVIPICPLPEQQRIVDRIESLLSKLEAARKKAQAVVDGYEYRRAAILRKAFTGELTAKWREEHGVGLDSWENRKFIDCIQKMQNGIAKRSGETGEPVVVLRLANLSDEEFITDNLREILLDEKEQFHYRLHENDVIMVRVNGSRGNVGKQYLIHGQNNWAFCDHLFRIVYNECVLPPFMLYFSREIQYRLYVDEHMVTTAGQNTISRKGMSKLLVPVPQIAEQGEIVRILDTVSKLERQAKESAERVLAAIDLMKQAILGRAFRGLLGTNDPAEPCEVRD